jgi:hypothetical protein
MDHLHLPPLCYYNLETLIIITMIWEGAKKGGARKGHVATPHHERKSAQQQSIEVVVL